MPDDGVCPICNGTGEYIDQHDGWSEVGVCECKKDGTWDKTDYHESMEHQHNS